MAASGASSGSGVKLGLGTQEHGTVAEGDDAFETYRKRMMLGYKHRPNPLGNPRSVLHAPFQFLVHPLQLSSVRCLSSLLALCRFLESRLLALYLCNRYAALSSHVAVLPPQIHASVLGAIRDVCMCQLQCSCGLELLRASMRMQKCAIESGQGTAVIAMVSKLDY